MGRYYASEAMRNPQLQQRGINYGIHKAIPILQKVGTEVLTQLSTKVRPNIRYTTDRPDLDGAGLGDFFDPRFVSQGVLVPKFATDPKFLKAFGKAIPQHHGFIDIAKKTARNYFGSGVPLPPFPFVDFKKLWGVVSNPKLFKGPEVSAAEGRKMVADYKCQYAGYKNQGGKRSSGSWIKWKGYGGSLLGDLVFASPEQLQKWAAFVPALIKGRGFDTVFKHTMENYYGKGVDIHSLIGKLPAPEGGWTLPGHKYTCPYNPLHHQLDYDPETGEILEIFQQPTGATDAVAMQHDVDYSSCGFRAKKYGEDEKNASTRLTAKWSKRLTTFLKIKDNGAIRWPATQLM